MYSTMSVKHQKPLMTHEPYGGFENVVQFYMYVKVTNLMTFNPIFIGNYEILLIAKVCAVFPFIVLQFLPMNLAVLSILLIGLFQQQYFAQVVPPNGLLYEFRKFVIWVISKFFEISS